jgi:subtilisin family serine protease
VPPPNSRKTSDIIFQVKPGTDVASLATEYGVTITNSSPDSNLYTVQIPAGKDGAAFAQELEQDSRFSAAEPDNGVQSPEQSRTVDGFPIHVPFEYITPTDARYASIARAYSASPSDTINPVADTQIDLSSVATITRGTGVTVAVLDTGVQANHPSLQSHLLPGYNAISPGSPPNDIADGSQNQALGHGTMVAGIIAAMAPNAQILPIRVLNGDGTGSLFGVASGLHWAVTHGAQVINMSFGTSTPSRILQNAIQEAEQAGVTVVAAAGNSNSITADYPAGFSGVLSVTSVDSNDTKSSFSNYGSWVMLSAPGSNITSTYVGGEFATWSGTSFAAPFVSGAATLVRSAHSDENADQVRTTLLSTAHSIAALNHSYPGELGSGIVDVTKAVTSIAPHRVVNKNQSTQ